MVKGLLLSRRANFQEKEGPRLSSSVSCRHSFLYLVVVFSGPALLLTSGNVKQHLVSAALDRYAGLRVGTA